MDLFFFFKAYQPFVGYLKSKHIWNFKNNIFLVSEYFITNFDNDLPKYKSII